MNPKVIRKIQKLLKPSERKRFLKHAQYASDWIADAARRIANEDNDG